jgi:hypothetical protein
VVAQLQDKVKLVVQQTLVAMLVTNPELVVAVPVLLALLHQTIHQPQELVDLGQHLILLVHLWFIAEVVVVQQLLVVMAVLAAAVVELVQLLPVLVDQMAAVMVLLSTVVMVELTQVAVVVVLVAHNLAQHQALEVQVL